MTYVLLAVSFALLVVGAIVFTNAVEWAGHRLDVGSGATGSVLAAVATALPESLVPIVAIVGGKEAANDVAVGAIVGAPFMLATVAMTLVGLAAFGFRDRRDQGDRVRADRPTLRRDFGVFFAAFSLALALGLVGPRAARIAAAAVLVVVYAVYVWRTIKTAGEAGSSEDLSALYVDPSKHDPPRTFQIVLQVILGIAAIAGGAHLFVEEITHIASSLGVSSLVLALVLAPFATELPEKLNSVIWVREGKDALALGNVTGAMVFQSCLPVAVGLAFTPWAFDVYPTLAAGLALAGGLVAFYATTVRCRFGLPLDAVTGSLFAAFIVYVALTAG